MKRDDLIARRAHLVREIEALLDKADAHPNAAIVGAIGSMSAEVDRIDRKLAAAARRRAREKAA